MLLTNTVKIFGKSVELITYWANYIAIGFLAIMMYLTAIDVFLRYLFNRPILGDQELIEFMMAIVVSMSIGYCALKKGHVVVDILFLYLPKKMQAGFNVFHYFCGFGFFALASWRTTIEGFTFHTRGFGSTVLNLPIYPFYWIVAFGCAVLSLTWLYLSIESLSQTVSRPVQDTEVQYQGGK
jgi:TRAP-type transport system small permease protein